MIFDNGINLNTGFNLQSPKPLDSRDNVETLSDLNSLTSAECNNSILRIYNAGFSGKI